MTFREAIVAVLKRSGPLNVADITKVIVDEGLVDSEGKTPAATISATIAVDVQKHGEKSSFVRLGDGRVAPSATLRPTNPNLAVPKVR